MYELFLNSKNAEMILKNSQGDQAEAGYPFVYSLRLHDAALSYEKDYEEPLSIFFREEQLSLLLTSLKEAAEKIAAKKDHKGIELLKSSSSFYPPLRAIITKKKKLSFFGQQGPTFESFTEDEQIESFYLAIINGELEIRLAISQFYHASIFLPAEGFDESLEKIEKAFLSLQKIRTEKSSLYFKTLEEF